LKLAGKEIRNDSLDPLIIAEIGVNYYDIAAKEGITPMEAAKLMLRECIGAGAHMAKFQTYKHDKIASKDSPAYWDTTQETTRSQYELFAKFDSFGEEDYRELAAYSESLGAPFLSTPFDLEAVDFLNDLMPTFKVASADITNLPLLRRVAEKGKPVILSGGASSVEDIDRALATLREVDPGCDIALLHCILNYPTLNPNANLGMILGLRDRYPDLPIGYSDHTLPSPDMLEVVTAVLYGACVIEKHFTLDKSLPGNDHYHAMDPYDLRNFVRQLARVRELFGQRDKIILESEAPAVQFARRSVVLAQDIPAGAVIREEDLIMKRPGTGISPVDLDRVIGRKAAVDLAEDQILQWEHLRSEG
jgi:N-acetylneuraminate synthase